MESVYEKDSRISQDIDVCTYGSAAAIPKYLARSVDQRASFWDPGPLADLVGRFSKDTSLTLVQPGGWLPSWGPQSGSLFIGEDGQKTWGAMCKKIREARDSR